MAKKVTMYATDWCGYCARARALLTRKGIAFEEIDVEAVSGAYQEMQRLSGRTSVPQILIDGQPIGGCEELQALEAEGRLEALLQ